MERLRGVKKGGLSAGHPYHPFQGKSPPPRGIHSAAQGLQNGDGKTVFYKAFLKQIRQKQTNPGMRASSELVQ